ncbi:MAG: hypothetical protein JW904_15280 [Spirochaetales bacterium]|nr:hypothetical protein [Spirochaetales bacterium]
MIFFRLFFIRIQESFLYELVFLKKSRQKKDYFFSLLFFIVLAVAGTFFCIYLFQIYRHLVIAGLFGRHPESVFFIASLLAWIVMLFTAIPRASRIFFHDSGAILLHTLPVSLNKITAARFLYFYVSLLPIQLIFGIPALAAYLADIREPISIIAGSAAFFVFSPLLPMGIALLAAFFLDRLFNVSQWRLVFEAVSLLCVFILLVGVQLVLQNRLLSATVEENQMFILQLADFLKYIIVAFPPAMWVASSYNVSNGLLYALLIPGCAGAVNIPAFLLIRHVSWRREMSVRKNIKAVGKPKIHRSGAMIFSLLFREWKVLLSHSIFFTEILVKLAVLPALLLLYSIAGPPQYIAIIVSIVTASPLMAIAAAGILVLLLDVSTVSATGISREKRTFMLSLQVPVSGRVQIQAKLLLHILVAAPSYALSAGLLYFIFALPLETLVVTIPAIIGFCLFSFCSSMLFELRRPDLSFLRQGTGMSPRSNVFVASMLQLILVAAAGSLAYAVTLLGMSVVMTGLLVTEMVIIIDFFLLRKVFSDAERLYQIKRFY